MFAFFRCIAEAVAENGLGGLVGMVPGGPFTCAVAAAAWKKYRDRKKTAEQRVEMLQLAEATFEQAKAEAVEVVRQVLSEKQLTPPAEQVTTLEYWLAGVPEATRTSLKRADDPSGRSLPPGFVLRDADDVEKLLPLRPPKFTPGAELPGKPGWILERILGIGGYGEVWFTRHPKLASLSGAVKFCYGEAAKNLQHEAALINRVMSAGQHPNIVPLKDAHLEGETPWLMYEYVAGGTLADWIHTLQRSTPERRQTQIVAALKQLAGAVGFFHQLDPPIIHRDLKPSNILLNKVGKKLQITDFGIGAITSRVSLTAEVRSQTTHTGRLLTSMRGSHTNLYAGPQQKAGADPDPRDDIHALGVIAYQMFTGSLATAPGRDMDDDLREGGADAGLIELLGKCVAQKAERRPRDAAELATRLATVRKTEDSQRTVAESCEPVQRVPLVSDTEKLKAFCREALEVLIAGDLIAWDDRWSVVRRLANLEQLKEQIEGIQKHLDHSLPTLGMPARERLRSACCESGAWPDHHLLAPTSLDELDMLLGPKMPPHWQGYTCFAVMGQDDKNWLLGTTQPYRLEMRRRVRNHLMFAPMPVLTAYLKQAKDYISTMPGFLYDLLQPFKIECVPFLSRVIDSGADVIEPRDWVKLLGDVDIYGQRERGWEGFLLRNDHLAKLLGGFKADPSAADVWGGYVELLGPALLDGDEWETVIYNQLSKARAALGAADIRLKSVAPPAAVRKLDSANALLTVMADPSAADLLEPGQLTEAFQVFGIDPLEGLRKIYFRGNFHNIDLNIDPHPLAPFLSLFLSCFPITQQYETARHAVSQWVAFSASCPDATRCAFQTHFIREHVPTEWHPHILSENPAIPFHRWVPDRIRLTSSAEQGSGQRSRITETLTIASTDRPMPQAALRTRTPGETIQLSLPGGLQMAFCWIPPGVAQLGAPVAELHALVAGREIPEWLAAEGEEQRRRYQSEGFWLGKYPVTQAEWKALTRKRPSYFQQQPRKTHKKSQRDETFRSHDRVGPGGGAEKVMALDTNRFPVERVNWDDCQQFLERMNELDGLEAAFGRPGRFALPHEDQWEYACRGGLGNGQAFYWGNELNGMQANSGGIYPYGTTTNGPFLERTTAVGSYAQKYPHPWGLCDMHGNVWEWCDNFFEGTSYRVLRGGCWDGPSEHCRAAYRLKSRPNSRGFNFGLRVLLSFE